MTMYTGGYFFHGQCRMAFFAFLPFDCPAYSLQEPVLHQSNGTDRNVCTVEFNIPFNTV